MDKPRVSKAFWGILVSAFFTLVTNLTPIPQEIKPALVWFSWTMLLFCCAGWLLTHFEVAQRIRSPQGAMTILIVAVVSALAGITVWMLIQSRVTTVTLPTSQPPATIEAVPPPPDDLQDSQYAVLKLSTAKKAEIDAMKSTLFRIKSDILDQPEYYKYRAAKDAYRAEMEKIEAECGCLIDAAKFQGIPKPPSRIDANKLNISITAKMVADRLDDTFFWVIRGSTKVRVPIALFVTLTNTQPIPLQIETLYLDAKGIDGWADIRMVGSLLPLSVPTDMPLVLQGKNAAMVVRGGYLLPNLYSRVIQPGDKVSGWLVAEYPKGFKDGTDIGDMRISLSAAGYWVASKTFPAHPRVYENQAFNFYPTPLDTMLTEDW